MKRALIAAASLACLIAAGVRFELVAQEALPPAEASAPEAGVVSGILIDAADGKPVAGAHVLLRGDELKTTTSDEEGRFRFEQLATSSQDYDLWAYRENHTTDRIQVRQLPGGNPDAARFAPLRLELKPGIQARFAVTSQETGAAIAGATVRVGYPDRRTETTNEDGIVTVRGLLPREYYVTVQMKGYAQSTPQIDLQGREGTAQYGVELSPGGEVHGVVVDEQGQPVPEASISYFIGSNGNGYYGDAPRTDANGTFQHSFLPLAVPVGVSVHADGYLPSRHDISVFAEQRVRDVRFSLSKRPLGGSVAGVVRDQTGTPVANAQVANYGDSSSLERRTTTDEAGRFVLHDLFDGYAGVSVHVSASGFAPQRVPVKPVAAAAPAEMAITLEPGHAIRGQIVNEAGKPVGGVYVMARSGAFRHGMEAIRADEQGEFSFDSLPADVLFQFGHPEFAYSQNIPLPWDGVDPVTVTLADPGVIRGQMLDSQTKLPVPQFRIRLGHCRDRMKGDVDGMYSGEWANPGLTFQAIDGRFSIAPLTARSSVELTIEADGYERLLLPRTVAKKAGASEELSISLRPMASEAPYALTTQLLNTDGQPLPNAELRLIVSTNSPAGADDKEFNWTLIDSGQLGQKSYVEQYLHGITDAEGKYEFKNILPGKYLQLVYWGPQVPKGRSLGFEVTRSGESDSVVIETPRPAVVRGTVDRSKFADAGGVRLSSTAHNFLEFQASLADDQSTFELRDLPPGEFWLSVDAKPVRFTENGTEFTRIAPLAAKKLVLQAGDAIEVTFDAPDEAR